MWPRADGPIAGGPPVRRAAGNNLGGFVAFLRRPDAVKAAKEFDGLEWGGNVLRIGWGKSVPLPSDAIYGSFFVPPRFEYLADLLARDRDRRSWKLEPSSSILFAFAIILSPRFLFTTARRSALLLKTTSLFLPLSISTAQNLAETRNGRGGEFLVDRCEEAAGAWERV